MAVVSTYATLKTAIADYLARSDLTSYLDNFIQNFEEDFYLNRRNWGAWMETAFSGTIAASVVAVPADFLAWKVATLGSNQTKLEPKPLAQLYAKFPRNGETGYPVWIARNASNFEFGPAPDSTYSVSGTYYAKQTVIRSDGDGVNWLITNAPQLYLYGSMVEACLFIKDTENAILWQQKLDAALTNYRDFLKVTDVSGGPLQVQLG